MININEMSDADIVQAIIKRNIDVTKKYLYEKCYPLFKAVYNKYYTDCETPIEFINDIYVYLMTPRAKENKSILESFGFRCTLTNWLKIVSENYCHQLYKKQLYANDNISNDTDRKVEEADSIDINLSSLDNKDVVAILNMMPNRRYSQLIKFRYLEEKTNEETAELLEMSMANYYNKHKSAKAQFKIMLKKEGLL